MTTPLRLFAVLGLFSLLFIGLESFADRAASLRASRCTGNSSGSYRCQAVESFWRGASGLPATCDERRQRAQKCCRAWAPDAECLNMLDDRGRQNLTALMAVTPGNHGSPSGVYGAVGADRVKNEQGRNAADSMEGLCRASMDACVDGCQGPAAPPPAAGPAPTPSAPPDDPTNKQTCQGLHRYADGFKAQADNFQTAINTNIQQQNQTGANNPGGNNPGGNSPGSGTQQPQSGQGQKQGQGGSPMDQLMKALQSAMKQDEQKDQQQQQPPAVDCSNPAIVGGNCPPQQVAAQSDSWNKKAGEAEMKDPEEKTDSGNFNVAGNEGGDPSFQGNGEKKFSTPPTVTPPGGGGGGGIPGGQGGPQAGGAAGGGGYAVSSKNLADVMHGTMSGGGYAAQAAAMNMQNGGGSGGYTYGQGGQDGMRGMDLRQFLPGGKSDPTRKLAGGNGLGIGGAGMQIQSQSVNIWNRITERIKSRCSQGLLRDCIP